MDERQGQMKDKAGLEDSRINEEFRDFLVKWGPRALIVVALVALAFSGRRWLNQKADERTDEAFVQLSLATSSDTTSPDTLLSLARQYDDIGAVAHVARMAAGEAYLAAVRRGVVIGAQPGPTGEYPEEELLDDELRTSYLGQARQAFQQVVDAEPADIHLVRAHMGLAAVAEAMGELDRARTHYQRAAELDRQAGYGAMAELAEARLNSLDALTEPVALPASAALPQPETPAAEDRDEDDPFGLGGLDLEGMGIEGPGGAEQEGQGAGTPPGGGLFDEPAGDPEPTPTEPTEPEPTDPPQDPGQ
ncbi:MAG: tol-pal system YbgF family protein [Phycisphaerales bacterium JB060]